MCEYKRKRKKVLPWTRREFWFCFVVIWTAVVFQSYALYQEWQEERRLTEAFCRLNVSEIQRQEEERNSDNLHSMTLRGILPGKVTLEEKSRLTARLFHSLDVKEVEAVREEELYTVYGFSTGLGESICYGENEINLNLVFTYDEEKGETVVYLAVPFLQMDF